MDDPEWMTHAEYTSVKVKITRNLKTLSPSSSTCRCQQQNQMPKAYLVILKQMKEAALKGAVMSLTAAKWHRKAPGRAADTAGAERSYPSGRTVCQKCTRDMLLPAFPACCSVGVQLHFPRESHVSQEPGITHRNMECAWLYALQSEGPGQLSPVYPCIEDIVLCYRRSAGM